MPHYNTKSEVAKGQNIYRNQYDGTTTNFSATRHLLLVWRGSCYKLIWHQISVWLFCYTFLSVLYRNVLYNATNPRHRQMFEMICIYAEKFSGLVPITFITGFYVTQVVNRWWDQFMSLPWPDRLALKLVTNIPNGAVSMDLDLLELPELPILGIFLLKWFFLKNFEMKVHLTVITNYGIFRYFILISGWTWQNS